MIVSFSVSNYRSFNSEATLSFVASKRLSGQHENHSAEIPGTEERVLRAGVLYGANGAGKSNLFAAIEFLHEIVQKPREKGSSIGRDPFKLTNKASEPTAFDLQFIASEKLYRYGVELDDEKVLQEWLLVSVGSREKVIYERELKNGNVEIDVHSECLEGAGEKLQALAKVGGPQNQTFLATVAANLDNAEYGDHLRSVLRWFEELVLISPNHHYGQLPTTLLTDEGLKNFTSEFLKTCSTGVDDIRVQKTPLTESEVSSLFSSEVAKNVMKHLKEGGHVAGPGLGGSELIVEGENKDQFYRVAVQTDHMGEGGQVVSLKLDDESDGTRRLIELIPALYYLQSCEGVFFIDEIDRSLHPILIWHFLEYFLKSCSGSRRQIVVTTHESNLLDLKLLRRDEIWFAEKDALGATQLYSLAEFKVRKDLEIQKHYLAGRFGAIPFLGSIERLADNAGEHPCDPKEATAAHAR